MSADPTSATSTDVVLSVRNLRTVAHKDGAVGACVEDVSFDLHHGEILGLIGESGSGKTMTAMSLMRLNPSPGTEIVNGEVWFEGRDLTSLPIDDMRTVRGDKIAYIPQDPLLSLDPVYRVGWQMQDAMAAHGRRGKVSLRQRAIDLLSSVQVPRPEERLRNYPHQFSGGMRQRVVSAIGFSCEPQVIIADEPTTALDVTVQAAYLELLTELKDRTGVSIIFITHDLGIVANLCDRVAVMYGGRIVEVATTTQLFESPVHPYTRALIESLPDPEDRRERLRTIPGHPPSIFERPTGCSFSPRCPDVTDRCRIDEPVMVSLADNRRASCWVHT